MKILLFFQDNSLKSRKRHNKSLMNCLKEIQIIVRYCFIEEPYWNAFINHYYSLGIRNIHVIVQFKEDKISLEKFYYPKDLEIFFHLSNELDPNKALINFKFRKIKKNSKYTLLIDCDEFIYFLNKNLNISELIDKKICLNLRWLMNPITEKDSLKSGFFGNGYKQLALSEKIISIKSCHEFNFNFLTNIKTHEASMYGLVLIHNWSRSLIDCLLKSSFSKIRNEKTIDQDLVLFKLKKGFLNVRAKYLAFLDIQYRYINKINDNYVNLFNSEKELEIVLQKFTESELNLFFKMYKEYKIKLINSKNRLENYPPLEGNQLSQMKRLNIFNFDY